MDHTQSDNPLAYEEIKMEREKKCSEQNVSEQQQNVPEKRDQPTSQPQQAGVSELISLYKLPEKLKSLEINDFLEFSSSIIEFGQVFPGYVIEQEVSIRNKSNQPLLVRMNIRPLDSQLDRMEEYVFSMRPSYCDGYNDRQNLLIGANSKINLRIALNTPYKKLDSNQLNGQFSANLHKFSSNIIKIPVYADLQMPIIRCLNQLSEPETRNKAIRLVLKGENQGCYKFQFLNESSLGFQVEMQFQQQKDNLFQYKIDLETSPGFSISPSSNFYVQLRIAQLRKQPMSFCIYNKQFGDSTDNHKKNAEQVYLIFKMKNTFNTFIFPIQIINLSESYLK